MANPAAKFGDVQTQRRAHGFRLEKTLSKWFSAAARALRFPPLQRILACLPRPDGDMSRAPPASTHRPSTTHPHESRASREFPWLFSSSA
jgi:hypothetical protein